MKVHKDITLNRIMSEMFGTESPGFCINCGEDAMNVEPDAERYECGICGDKTVYGAEQLLLMLVP
jgi:ribosomal protein S27AE